MCNTQSTSWIRNSNYGTIYSETAFRKLQKNNKDYSYKRTDCNTVNLTDLLHFKKAWGAVDREILIIILRENVIRATVGNWYARYMNKHKSHGHKQ